MKVAIIMPLAEQRGGAELMLMHLLRANRVGPQVEYHLAFLEEGPLVDETVALGYPVQVFPAGQIRQVHRQLSTVWALKQWMQRERVDVAMSWMSKAHLYAGPAARMVGIPSVWWQHNIPDGHWLGRWATLISAKRVFCCSQAAQQAQQKLKPKRATSVIYPAVDLRRLNPALLPCPIEARRMLGLPEKGPIIGVVSRLQRSKGVHVFLDAAAEVVKTHPDVYFVVVGGKHGLEPDCPNILATQTEALGLSEKVCFTGYQANTELWMQAMDVVVLPSIGTESFGMVIIEGMALGKTVIASKAGGPQEIIEDGVNGYLTERGNASVLAETIRQVIKEPNQQAEIQAAARRKASSFSTEKLASEVAQSLQMMLS